MRRIPAEEADVALRSKQIQREFACGLLVRVFLSGFLFLPIARAQTTDPDVAKKLGDFDAYMEQTLKDWNTPGIGVGVVVEDKLAFAKGYGYRDYGKKAPFTPTTLQAIASN